MKIKFYSLILFLFATPAVTAQSPRILDANEYDQLKRANQLPEKFLLKKTEGSQAVLMPRIHPSANTVQSNSICNCLLPLDTTFSVVPFTNGIAPDYRNDDGSSAAIILPFSFCFAGMTMDSIIYINNNGNVSFLAPYYTYTANGFPDATHVMIAPFWADVDTRDSLSGLVYYKVTPTALIVKWEHVGYFGAHGDKLNTFQLIITDGTDPIISGGSVAFCYGDMQWTTGDASTGTNGFGGTPATVGTNLGNGIDYIQFGTFDQAGYAFDGAFGANDGVDWLDSSSFIFDMCGLNTPPVPFDCNNDTVYLRAGDTTNIDVSFFDPSPGQIVTITANSGSLANLTTISNTSGSLARYQGTLIADISNLGFNTFTLSATDNGSPPQTTTYNRVLHIDQVTGIQHNQFSPLISFSPNPFTEQTTLTISNVNSKNISLIICDVIGHEVLRVDQVPSTLTIEKGNLTKGIYIYHLIDGDRMNETGKIIIQ